MIDLLRHEKQSHTATTAAAAAPIQDAARHIKPDNSNNTPAATIQPAVTRPRLRILPAPTHSRCTHTAVVLALPLLLLLLALLLLPVLALLLLLVLALLLLAVLALLCGAAFAADAPAAAAADKSLSRCYCCCCCFCWGVPAPRFAMIGTRVGSSDWASSSDAEYKLLGPLLDSSDAAAADANGVRVLPPPLPLLLLVCLDVLLLLLDPCCIPFCCCGGGVCGVACDIGSDVRCTCCCSCCCQVAGEAGERISPTACVMLLRLGRTG